MSLRDALRRVFGRSYQPRHPPRPELTPEEEVEPCARRLAVDEAKTTDRGQAREDEGQA
jgi:hypothetical protein